MLSFTLAMGASLLSKDEQFINLNTLIDKIQSLNNDGMLNVNKLEPLFKGEKRIQ